MTDTNPELRELLEDNAVTIETDDGEYLAVDIELILPLLSQHEQEAERKIVELSSHLAYMAGEFEGMTGHKSGYLLKNWKEYADLSPTQEKRQG